MPVVTHTSKPIARRRLLTEEERDLAILTAREKETPISEAEFERRLLKRFPRLKNLL